MTKESFMCDMDHRQCTETEGCSGALEDCKYRLEFFDFKGGCLHYDPMIGNCKHEKNQSEPCWPDYCPLIKQ